MIETFKEFKDTKSIDRTTLVSVLEESFRNVLAKIFGSDENFDVIVNPDKGDFEIHRNRVVVTDGEVEDENKQISLPDARKIAADYEVGEDVSMTPYIINTRTVSGRSSRARSTRPGNARCCSSTTRTTS